MFPPDYPTLRTRIDLADLCAYHGYVSFLEIGVDIGLFAAQILNRNKSLFYYGVDPYLPYREIAYDRSSAKRMARANLSMYTDRAVLIEESSLRAAEILQRLKINELDFVYIDGAHDAVSVSQDLNAWYPLVRSGGILAGHDFDLASVSEQVYRFAQNRFIVHAIPDMGNHEKREPTGFWAHPSWYIYKP